jgi:hypothetical protein
MPKPRAHAAEFRRVLKLQAVPEGKRRVYHVNRVGFDSLTGWIDRMSRAD